ncbi:DUF4132 domain-containing protein [Actinomadura viridis]|uniref:DUF4132 domain-containing protein n=1 Tax=Actinomadura viridis TaxID=58110 RepID=A0A931GKV4_9ACTN|nr:DUF4132 domain-containing protein [Actinomadura viridis]MBG6090767.1 hypothetical protein [Actinomadura viridis]
MTDEDSLLIPDSWRTVLYPRRGGVAGPGIELDATAPGALRQRVERRRSVLDALVAGTGAAPEIVDGLRAYLGGAADPLGAAAAVRVAFAEDEGPSGKWLRRIVDAWVGEHGVVFAARACVEFPLLVLEARRWSWKENAIVPFGLRFWSVTDATDGWFVELLVRMRAILAAADERDYQEAVRGLEGHRGTQLRRLVVSFLVPTRRDWVEECLAEPPGRDWIGLLWCSIGGEQARRLKGTLPYLTGHTVPAVVATVVEGAGTAVVPALVQAVDADPSGGPDRVCLLEALGVLPCDEAFGALVARMGQKHVLPALTQAMERFPARALRLLAEAVSASKDARAKGLLTWHLKTHPEVVGRVLPELPDRQQALVEAMLAAEERVEEAPAEALPRLLVEPPWKRRKARRKPVVVAGLAPAGERDLVWAPGERDAWRNTFSRGYGRWFPADSDWAAQVRLARAKPEGREIGHLIAEGPEEMVRPLIGEWRRDGKAWDADDGRWLRAAVARHGFDALPVALEAARANPAGCGKLLLPYLDGEVAELMAGWLGRLKSARHIAVAWFGRHGAAGARWLVPAALGAGPERRDAERALLLVGGDTGAETIVDRVRDDHGAEAADAIGALLATDPLDILPARVPKTPAWADPAVLPQVLLEGRVHALPDDAAAHLVTMLAMSKPGDVYAGLEVVREVCDAESLAEFAWALFERWRAYGEPSRDAWAMNQLALLGNDRTVRALTPVIRAWPGQGGHRKAVAGLDVLAGIGTDVALMHLHGLTKRLKFKGLKARVQEKIQDVAAERGLTPAQLADRMVPDFGLGPDGSMILDYGPRRFVVGFDEQLNPYVSDEDGTRRKLLPRPGAKDDPKLAPVAQQRFTALKKEVRAVAEEQIRRLEAAMTDRRRWSPAEFRDLFAAHPLLWHIARRLVWLAEDGGKSAAFRLAEDRSLADVDDAVFTLAESARVGVAHPLDLGDRLGDWSQAFQDYELMQPFEQLDRTVHALTPEERESTRLKRFEGLDVPSGRMPGLRRRGWRRHDDHGVYLDGCAYRQVAPDLYVVVDMTPVVGSTGTYRNQKTTHVWVGRRPGDYDPARRPPLPFGEVPPAAASEVLAALIELTEPPER